jgi:hypothetical protein
MTNEQQQSPIFCLDKVKKHLYNTIWGIKPLLMKQQHDVNFDFTMPLVIHLALSVSQPASRTYIVNAILEHIHDRYMLCIADING